MSALPELVDRMVEAELRSYLDRLAALARKSTLGPKLSYYGVADIVLQHGRWWRSSRGEIKQSHRYKGEPKQCFANAQRLVVRARRPLTYVEGFALSVIPIHHGWCVDADGRVIDPTWRDRPSPVYLGVPFKRAYVLRLARESGWWSSLFDNWSAQPPQPIITGKHPIEDWLDAAHTHGEPLC